MSNELSGDGGGDSAPAPSFNSGDSQNAYTAPYVPPPYVPPSWTYSPPGDQAPVDQTNYAPVDSGGAPAPAFDFSQPATSNQREDRPLGSISGGGGDQQSQIVWQEQAGVAQQAQQAAQQQASLQAGGNPYQVGTSAWDDTQAAIVQREQAAVAQQAQQAQQDQQAQPSQASDLMQQLGGGGQAPSWDNPNAPITLQSQQVGGEGGDTGQPGQLGAGLGQGGIGPMLQYPPGIMAPPQYPQVSTSNHSAGPPTAADVSTSMTLRQSQDYVRASAAVADYLARSEGRSMTTDDLTNAITKIASGVKGDKSNLAILKMRDDFLRHPEILSQYNAIAKMNPDGGPAGTTGPATAPSVTTQPAAGNKITPQHLEALRIARGGKLYPGDENMTEDAYAQLSAGAQKAGQQQPQQATRMTQEAALGQFGKSQVESNRQAQRTSTADTLIRQGKNAINPMYVNSINASLSEQGLPTIDANAANAQQQIQMAEGLLPHLLTLLQGPNAALMRPVINQMLQQIGFQGLPSPADQGGQGVMPNGIDPATWDKLPDAAKNLILQAWKTQGGTATDFTGGIDAQRPAGTRGQSNVNVRYAPLRA